MSETVVIPQRFCGPPNSGNGGYTSGLVASYVDAQTAEVTLHAPPPLERPLQIVRSEDETRLLDGESIIAIGRPVETPVTPSGGLVDHDQAVSATANFNHDLYSVVHDFPTCFTCGPARVPGDGLRIFPGSTDRPEVCAWAWDPHEDLFDGGKMDSKLIWAALDCPSGQSWLVMDPGLGACVLGRMTATINRGPKAGEPLTVFGLALEARGRRLTAESAITSIDGEVLAAATTTWIQLTPEQRAAFATHND